MPANALMSGRFGVGVSGSGAELQGRVQVLGLGTWASAASAASFSFICASSAPTCPASEPNVSHAR
eukprot:2976951-Rhodomonas_salina.3